MVSSCSKPPIVPCVACQPCPVCGFTNWLCRKGLVLPVGFGIRVEAVGGCKDD